MILSYRFACRRTDSDGPPTFFHRTAPLSKFGNVIIPQCLIGSWMAGPPSPANIRCRGLWASLVLPP